MAKAIKTIKVKINNPNKGKGEALHETINILNEVLATYIDLTLQKGVCQQKEWIVNSVKWIVNSACFRLSH